VGVKLRFAPKVLSFDPADTQPEAGDHVIVETERGREIGQVIDAPHDVAASQLVAPLKPVVRVAGEADLVRAAELEALECEALPQFRALIAKHKIDMKPVHVEYLFDGNKIVFYFSAEERVDFRDLVRELASTFKARIDMRQVGVRDEARMVDGVGHCGQQLCCARLGGDFQPVSIRMAKEQDLPLNPLKISGLCGRLMCCLRYEYDAYKDYKQRAPKRGAMIDTPLGEGKVRDLNTPKETVTMWVAEAGKSLTVPLSSMGCGSGKGCPCKIEAEALEALGVTIPAPGASIAGERAARSSDRGGRKGPSSGGSKERSTGESSTGSSRKPRREKTDRSTAGAAEAAKADAAPKADAGPKAGAGAEGESGSKAAKSSGRRRRRRRPSGGGNKESGTPT
jgi:cell fate regulator YaaT (PSP1 superfamily)